MKAVLCPVCSGSGVVWLAETGTVPTYTCNGCEGKGWVMVAEKK